MAQVKYETIFLGRDNYSALILSEAGVPQDLSGVTKIICLIGTLIITSTDKVAGAIRWAQPGYATGETRMFLGATVGLTASSAVRDAWIIVFDATNTDGVVWGSIPVLIEQV